MSYCTVAQVRLRARQITSRTRDDDAITDAIGLADAEVDARLENFYGDYLPFASTPDLISQISRNLAGALLLDEVYGEDNPVMSAYAAQLRDWATHHLDKIAEGDEVLVITSRTLPNMPKSSTYDPLTDIAVEQIFTRGDWDTWKLPEDFDDLDEDIDDRVS